MISSSRFGAGESLQVLWQDNECVFGRGSRVDASGQPRAVLIASPAGERPSPAALDRLADEFELRDELDGAWALRPLELVREHGRTMLVLEDPGGEPLARMLGSPMEIGAFLRLAIGVAAALGKVHQRGLVHKDLKPAHVLVNCADGEVRLTGFGIASRLLRERQALEPPETIAGTLAYMAPEQTGRMNRSIDSRSDLYSLGVTFYQMLTGSLPFAASDPMEWVHCHIARQPLAPSRRLQTVLPPLSQIVMKLLAKTAEERYQTAGGVERDLERCLADWEAHRRIDDFPLGQHDTPDRLLIPEKLYGRAREVETLVASFDRIVKSGAPELVLVSGYSGIGKSSVVNELHKVLVPPRGLFASGKFDQYKRDIPYSTLVQAFQSLVRPLLGKSDAELAIWRGALLEALGPNARLMTDFIPELKLIIGDQPPVPELEPQDAQRRFQHAFRRLIGVFAKPDHPLALFLDDLQWLDAATLDLIEDLLTRSDLQHLMLIGAYRDNEVDAAHPLARKLEAIKNAGGKIETITLAPLTPECLGELIADAFRCEPERAAPLAELAHDKTAGNPFFVIQFLHALAEEDLLCFDHKTARWAWDLDRIHAKGYADNVVDLMVGKLNRLPAETQNALQHLACLGNVAATAMLSTVLGSPAEQAHAALWPAVRLELVERLEGRYRFIHDRVQEAAYSLIPEALRAEVHLRIGRLLAAQTPPEKREEAIFDIVNQLNRGAALIAKQEERDRLAELNLIAGKRAKTSTAYASALAYLNAGAALLAEDCWNRRQELIFALELHRSECEFLTGQLSAADKRLAALSKRAATAVDQALVACLHIDVCTTLNDSGRAVDVCLNYLKQLGIEWSPHPTDEEVRREYEVIWSMLSTRTIEDLIDLPLMSDPASLATLDVLTKVAPAAWFTDTNSFSLATCRAVNLSIENGNSDGSCLHYENLGLIAGAIFNNYRAGFRFGRLGYELVEKRGLKRFRARTYTSFGSYVMPWTKRLRDCRDLIRRGFDDANKIGDLTFAAYSCYCLNSNLLAAGDPLAEVQREAENGLEFAQRAQFGLLIDIVTAQFGLVRTLRGSTQKFGSFDDGGIDELVFEQHLASGQVAGMPVCFYWIRKLQARFLAGDYASAVDASLRAQPLLWTSASLFETAEYHFCGALARAACCDAAFTDGRQQHFEALAAHHRQLEAWAENCPENFENRAALVGAEIARLEGRVADAMSLYELAIRSARLNGFVHNEAIAFERASNFYRARGFDQIAELYLRNARSCYQQWGADGKVRQLEEMYPHLRTEEASPGPTSSIATPVERLDLATVIKVSQAVSGEMVLEKLIDTLMRTAIEQAGAERGLLIMSREAEPRIEAEATTSGDTVSVQLHDAPVTASALPDTVLHTVLHTRESVILDDAATEPSFAADPYVRQRQARSILCLPLINQAKLIGVLYLENNLTPRAFAPARIPVLKLLASQAAVSLENARLHAELINENRERQQAEDALRASEERWRSLFENVPIGVGLIAPHGRYLAANQALQTMLDYSEAELRGRSPIDVTHEDDRAASEAFSAARAAGDMGTFRGEKRYRRKDGGIIWADVTSFLPSVAAGSAPLLAVFAVDITERKRAEDDLRRSEAFLIQAQQISQTGSWYWNVETGEVRWSAEHYRIFGYDPTTTQPSYATFTERIDPDDRVSLEQAIAASVVGKAQFQLEYRITLPDGSVKHLLSLGRPRTTDSGALEFVGTVMDITERKRAEAEARDSERRYREVQTALAHANRVATMGQLTASIAHEVNQPIAAAVTNANTALRWLSARRPNLEEARRALGRIVENGSRAGEVIGRIRALIKKEPPQKEGVTINDAILEVVALTHGEAVKNRVSVRTQLAEGLPTVEGDRVQLQQVLLNLVVNAIEAMSGQNEAPRELLLSTEKAEPDGVLVAVRDSGPGLAPETLERLFDAFYTTKADGMGMGLSICRSIIEAHGGRLWASANEPRGAVFQFSVPSHPAHS